MDSTSNNYFNPISRATPLGGQSNSLFTKMSGYFSGNNLIFIVALILFLIIAGVYYYYYILPGMQSKYKPNNEKVINDDSGNTAELLFFYANWCPHCKTAKPVWNDTKTEYEGTVINGYKLSFLEYNCTKETPETQALMDKYKIEGFPSIILIKDNQVIDYDAKPSKATIVQFLNTVL